jgi:hypothetical protein
MSVSLIFFPVLKATDLISRFSLTMTLTILPAVPSSGFDGDVFKETGIPQGFEILFQHGCGVEAVFGRFDIEEDGIFGDLFIPFHDDFFDGFAHEKQVYKQNKRYTKQEFFHIASRIIIIV